MERDNSATVKTAFNADLRRLFAFCRPIQGSLPQCERPGLVVSQFETRHWSAEQNSNRSRGCLCPW